MASHPSTSLARYAAKSTQQLQSRSEVSSFTLSSLSDPYRHDQAVQYHGSIGGGRFGYQGPRLPPITSLKIPGFVPAFQSLPSKDRDSIAIVHTHRQAPSGDDGSSTTSPRIPSASFPSDSCAQSCSENILLDLQCSPSKEFEGTTVGPRELAISASEIVQSRFGKLKSSALMQIRANVDASRPLFGSGIKSSTKITKGSKIGNHSMAERIRRRDHQVAQQQQGKRLPTAILELASYKPGTGKPPGKHHLFVGSLLMYEFDSLLEAKQQEEILALNQRLRFQGQEQDASCFRHRPSSAPEIDAASYVSQRK